VNAVAFEMFEGASSFDQDLSLWPCGEDLGYVQICGAPTLAPTYVPKSGGPKSKKALAPTLAPTHVPKSGGPKIKKSKGYKSTNYSKSKGAKSGKADKSKTVKY